MVGLFVDPKNHKVTYYDGGDAKFSATTLANVGKSLAAVFNNWDKVKNRVVRVQDAVVTQKQLVEAAKNVQKDGAEWDISNEDTSLLEKQARESFAKGDPSVEATYNCIKRSIWGAGFGGEMMEVDNDLLGLPQMSKAEVQEVVARYC